MANCKLNHAPAREVRIDPAPHSMYFDGPQAGIGAAVVAESKRIFDPADVLKTSNTQTANDARSDFVIVSSVTSPHH